MLVRRAQRVEPEPSGARSHRPAYAEKRSTLHCERRRRSSRLDLRVELDLVIELRSHAASDRVGDEVGDEVDELGEVSEVLIAG